MNDVLLFVLIIMAFATVMLSIAWWQEGRDIERRKNKSQLNQPTQRT